MSATTATEENRFLSTAITPLFFKTAAPIVVIMIVNGLYNVVDAWYLGEFVGADALTAVSLMFPLQMMLFALSAMVSAGLSSMLARRFGANDEEGSQSSYTTAHVLVLVLSGLTMALFFNFGEELVFSVADGSAEISALSYSYIQILMFSVPILFALPVHVDVLRAEGAMKVMTLVTLSATFLNIIFNYVFIVILDMGVDGSAYGTVVAQTLCLISILVYYRYTGHMLRLTMISMERFRADAAEMLALGAPSTLSFFGVSLMTIVAIYSLQFWPPEDYEATVGAYGIAIRLSTFVFLPLMGIAMAFQTIVGHNFGAEKKDRVNECLKLSLKVAFIYCLVTEIVLIGFARWFGALFVDDTLMVSESARLLPYMMSVFVTYGPTMVVAQYFQAIGHAKNAAMLNLFRTYVFTLPLTVILPFFMGEEGIWMARPLAEVGVFIITIMVLSAAAKRNGTKYGLFYHTA